MNGPMAALHQPCPSSISSAATILPTGTPIRAARRLDLEQW
jgi:hypothetical protein